MLDFLSTQASTSHMMPWSFLFATALIASALDAFSRRLFGPVVMTTWFFGLSVAASLGGWSIPELTAGAICLVTPHLLICSVSVRARSSKASKKPAPAEVIAAESPAPQPFEFQKPKLVSKQDRRAA